LAFAEPNPKLSDAQPFFCVKIQILIWTSVIPENPAAAMKHFNELRDRPIRRMLTVEEELRILEAAPPHLRVAMILLSQTGG
jgi:hypothetical protein